jgi:hypothetical protein
VAYHTCPAADVELTATVSRSSYGAGQTVAYQVALHNLSGRTCAGGSSLPTLPGQPGRLAIGLCGDVPVRILDAKGAPVFPGSESISCPVLLGPPLPAHGTLRASGTWNQEEGGVRPARTATAAPRGRYRLVVGASLQVPFALTG